MAYRNVVDFVPKLLSTAPSPDLVLHIGLAASRNFYAIEQGAHSRGYGKINDVDGQLFPDSEAQKSFPSAKYPTVLHTSFDTEDVLSRWRTALGQYHDTLHIVTSENIIKDQSPDIAHPHYFRKSRPQTTNPHTGHTTPDGSRSVEPLPDVRINPDAGNFLCGFIYYNSLAHYHVQPTHSNSLSSSLNGQDKAEKPVMFMHVPDLSGSEAKLREGWEVAVALVKALVESRRKVGIGRGNAEKKGEGVGQEDDARNNTVT